MRTIRTYNTSLGGYEYRATGNSHVVNLQEKSPASNSWRTMRTISRDEWADLVDMTIAQFARMCNG